MNVNETMIRNDAELCPQYCTRLVWTLMEDISDTT